MKGSDAREKMVVLDRDGTLVVDRGYLANPDGLEFESGAAEGLRTLFVRGYRFVVITNQSGIGRGYFELERMEAMNLRLQEMVRAAGADIEGIYFCPHSPEMSCDCRKPALGLMMQAAADLDFYPARCVVIGDKLSDVEFGRRAGATTILVAAPTPAAEMQPRADFVVPDFAAAARAILRRNA